MRRAVAAAALLICAGSAAWSAPPRLYSRPGYQSPVHADADDLLTLMGTGLSASDTVLIEPATAARRGDAESVAPIVNSAGAPYAVIVRLPRTLEGGTPYSLRVRNRAGESSNTVRLNDSRPLWFSPAEMPSRGVLAGLPRSLTIVGRNLRGTGDATRVRLSGPGRVELSVPPQAGAADDYRRSVPLPETLPAGQYRVEFARDGGDWIGIDELQLEVTDESARGFFDIADRRFGACRADDGQDDTVCLRRAIEAARGAGGGTVLFGAGTWDLEPTDLPVPPGVDLQGGGSDSSILLRQDGPRTRPGRALLVLLGDNRVSQLAFRDSGRFEPDSPLRPVLQLGPAYRDATTRASHIVVTGNLFDRTNGAIVDAGASLDHIYITRNQIGDYRRGIYLGGSPEHTASRFTFSDSVIAYNRFAPGSYLDLRVKQGALASEIGASRRVDFSHNVADGADRRFLTDPKDPAGFRAAFFWHMTDSHEMLLIADNTASCTGDKDGDGEAIALDNNLNGAAFSESRLVQSATGRSVRVRGPLKDVQNRRAVDVRGFYLGYWLRVDEGPGLGQARRIVGYQRAAGPDEYEFEVAPAFDVPPEAGTSRVSVARAFWQTQIVGNRVDHRTPLCLKSNRTRPKGGVIALWAQMSDGVVAANRQYDTDGILLQQAYGADEAGCAECQALNNMPSFIDIVDNEVDGEYDWNSACSQSGISASYAATPSHGALPLLSLGVNIAHNRITHADGLLGGAIDVVPTWHRGPPGYLKPLLSQILLQHNEIRDVGGPPPRAQCGYVQRGRYGIHLQGEHSLTDTTLYGNRCIGTPAPLRDAAVRSTRVCPSGAADDCECHALPPSESPSAGASPPGTPGPAP